MKAPLLVLSLASAACVSPPAARFVLPDTTVRAPTEALAREAAWFSTLARAGIEERVPGLRPGGVEVWMQEDLDAGPFETPSRPDISGFTLRGWWHREPRIHVPVAEYRATLVHELVHALLGPDWNPLPAALEEGLADTIAVDVAGSPGTRLGRLCAAARRRSLTYRLAYDHGSARGTTTRWLSAGGVVPELADAAASAASASGVGEPSLSLREVLEIEARSVWRSQHPDEVGYVYGVGYFVADRIASRGGYAALHELCVAATARGQRRVPVERLLAAADIADERAFVELVNKALEREMVRLLLESEPLGRFLRSLSAAHPEVSSWEELFALARPRVSIDGGDYLPLAELPGFADWTARNPFVR